MFPHADTICRLGELDYQELLRTAAQRRLAATADKGKSPHDPLPRPAQRAISSWFGQLLRPAHRLHQAWRTAGGPCGSAPSARPVA